MKFMPKVLIVCTEEKRGFDYKNKQKQSQTL